MVVHADVVVVTDDGSPVSQNAWNKKHKNTFWVVNPDDFGAVGDDATDSTAAFAAARASGVALYPNGFQFHLNSGKYRVSGVTAFATDKIEIVGQGRGSTHVKNTDAYLSGDIFTFGANSQVTLRSFSIWSDVSRTGGKGIGLSGSSSLIIEDMFIWNQFIAIEMLDNGGTVGQLISIRDLTIHAPNTSGCYGMNIDVGGGDIFIGPNVIVSQVNAAQHGTGIQLNQTLYLSAQGMDVVGFKNNLVINPPSNKSVTWCFFDDVLFDTAGEHGVVINSNGSTQKVQGVYFNMCWFATSGATGGGSGLGNGVDITVAAGGIVNDVRFINPRVINNKNHGISIAALARNIHVTGGTVAANSQQTANTYDGVRVAAGTENFSVTGVRLGGAYHVFANQQKYAVNILAGASDHYSVTGNDVSGNTTGNNTGGIFDGGTGLDKRVQDNLGSIMLGALSTKGTTTVVTTTELLITPATPVAARDLRVGSAFRLTAWGIGTGVGGGTSIVRIRAGTAGTTSDAAVFTGPTHSQGAGSNIPWRLVIDFIVSAIGSSGTIVGSYHLLNVGTTGIVDAAQTLSSGTPATFNTTTITTMEGTLVLTGAGSVTVQGAELEQVA